MSRWTLLIAFCATVCVDMYAQKERDIRVRIIEQYLLEMAQDMTDDGENLNAEMALEYFEQLLEMPLNINKAVRGDLERLFLLSDFQISSLINYRVEHGDILSGAELSLLNGFNERLAEMLGGFIVFEDTVGEGKKSSENLFKDCYSTLLFKVNRELEKKTDSEYLGTPYFMQLKYKCEYLGRVQVGITLENDVGEKVLSPIKLPMGDFFSFHAAFRDFKIAKKKGKGLVINNLIIGDFSARFGQGLALWNSFSLMGASNPQGLYKRGAVIIPYTSSYESNFFRGAAISCSKEIAHKGGRGTNELGITALFSYNSLDANVKDNVYTSIIGGGLHNTSSTYSTRKTMFETVGAINAVMRLKKIKLGFTWISYGYNKENGRKMQQYNKYQMYNGSWGNFSVDFYTVIKRYRIFSEIAFDYGGSFAALAGSIFNIGSCEIGVLGRSYSKSYIATHANAYSTIGSCSNQNGIAINAVYPLSRLLRISSNIDFAHYPWQRFNIPTASAIFKLFIKLEYTGKKINGYLRFTDSYSTYKFSNKIGMRGLFAWHLCRNLDIGLRGDVVNTAKMIEDNGDKTVYSESYQVRSNSLGYAAAVDLDYKLQSGRFRIQAGGTYFNSMDWDTRMYMYEADLPNSFSSQLLYGNGFRGYILVQAKPLAWMDIYLKADTIRYWKRGGNNEIPAPLSKIKLALKIRF